MEQVPRELLQGLVASGRTYQQIAAELKRLYPNTIRGLSSRSVRRYVAQLDIKSAVARDVHQAVREAIDEVRVQHACYL